jgi:mono/diheme cytochrome c family protein
MQPHRRAVLLSLFVFEVMSCPLPFALRAQQSASGPTVSNSQKEGRRIFQQKCAVCHVPASAQAKTLGPNLFKGTVEGNEESIRMTIQDGRGDQMPGFKYALDSKQIDAVIEYLKSLDKPARAVASEHPEM